MNIPQQSIVTESLGPHVRQSPMRTLDSNRDAEAIASAAAYVQRVSPDAETLLDMLLCGLRVETT